LIDYPCGEDCPPCEYPGDPGTTGEIAYTPCGTTQPPP
jgi:hypothetical protein